MRLIEDQRIRRVFDALAMGGAFYLVQQTLWPAPFGVVVQGMVIGGLTALIAFGIALVYRANRIINFAQGDLGGVPAVLTVLLIVGPGIPFALALPIGILAAVVLGILVETLIVRRFFRAPRLILTVVTIGLAQILAAFELQLPRAFDIRTPPQTFPSPFDFSFRIDPLVFRGNDVIAMIFVPLVVIGLVAFFRFTDIGIAVRASAERADRAALLGIPVRRVHTIVWVVATVLATLAMLLRAGVVGLPIGSVLGPTILLRSLAAAVIGRMERLPTIFFAAVGLGIIEQAVVWDTGRSILVNPILFVVVLGGLLLQRRGEMSRAHDAQTSTWQAAGEVRAIPRELARLPEVLWVRRGISALAIAFVLLVPVLFSVSQVNLIAVVAIFAIIGISLVVLTGWAGQVSLGQMAFVGLGAAVAGSLTSRTGWEMAPAIAVAGLVGAFVAMVVGIPALRIRGLFLAVATLAFALATSSYLLNEEFFDWWLPTERIERVYFLGRVVVESETRFYYLCVVGLALAIAAARGLRRSDTGRVLIATRENERAAQAYGVNVTRARLTAFAVSGFLAAYAGALFAHHQQGLAPSQYAPEESLRVFTMVVVGGLGSVPGAILGAIYVRGGLFFLPQAVRFLVSGAGLVLILMIVPGGLGSILYGLRDAALRRVAARREIVVPSLVADVRVDASPGPAHLVRT